MLIRKILLQKSLLPLGLVVALSFIQAVEARVQNIAICYNFSCKTLQQVALSAEEWRSVIGWFYPAAHTAAEEREQLRQAIGWMEVVVGRHTPTHRDKGLNLEKNPEFPGQLDCIDESLNITSYMQLFQEQGHLRRHRVVDRAYRKAGFDAHWAGRSSKSTRVNALSLTVGFRIMACCRTSPPAPNGLTSPIFRF